MRLVKIIVIICALLFLFVSCKLSTPNNEKEQISYHIPTIESTTSAFQIMDDNKVKLSTLSFFIPEDFKIKPSNGELVVEAKNSTVQFTIEEKTNDIDNFDNYIQETIVSLEQMGLSPETVESTKIKGHSAKRFIVDSFDITSSNIRIFCYFIDINDSKIVINVISKDMEINDATDADKFVSSIEFD